MTLAQNIVIGVFIAYAIWNTGRAVMSSVRERRRFSKRKTYSLRLDLTILLVSSVLGVGAALLLMLALDRLGLLRTVYLGFGRAADSCMVAGQQSAGEGRAPPCAR